MTQYTARTIAGNLSLYLFIYIFAGTITPKLLLMNKQKVET
jgi:hypothetical protein